MRVAIFPARGGSQRIKRKNCRDFRGRPMIAWPIEAAKASGLFDMIIVSTDDAEIERIALGLGCVVHRRPPDNGSKGTQEVAADVLHDFPSATEACVIYPCSPLLTAEDLKAAWSLWYCSDASYVMSVQPAPLADAGCFYFGAASSFRDGEELINFSARMYPLPQERCIDINVESDWARAEAMFDALQEKK